jgi:exodeoxyribonuclease V alpha subunit
MAGRVRWSAETVRTPGCLWPVPADLPGLSDHQRRQLERGLRAPVALLTGTPGTGKTFVLARVVWALCQQYDRWSVAVCAPTGKAAVRVTEAIRAASLDDPDVHAYPRRATTVHQLLEVGRNGHDGEGWGFQRNASRPVEERFVVCDEASMLDTDLFAALLRACGKGTHLLLVGDPHQLPPVGHGFPLRDLIASGKVPMAELTEIRRNAGMIVEQCRNIKDGVRLEAIPYLAPAAPFSPETNVRLISYRDATSQQEAIASLFDESSNHPVRQGFLNIDIATHESTIQVICATNANSPVSRNELNAVLQDLCNPDGYRIEGNPMRVGDKVICTRNGMYPLSPEDASTAILVDQLRYVANGQIGRVVDILPETARVAVVFDQSDEPIWFGRPRREHGIIEDEDRNPKSRVVDLELAYAITCHKSQGSEWPVVVVALEGSRRAVGICDRHWLYTAISRAKQLCILVGDLGVARQMCVRDVASGRLTFLAEELKNGC